jgi:hypothetical protein
MPRNATIADLVVEANDTGKEAIFLGTDGTTSYEFTPAGIAQYMSDEGLTGGGSEGEPVADLGPGDVEVLPQLLLLLLMHPSPLLMVTYPLLLKKLTNSLPLLEMLELSENNNGHS